MIDPKVPESTLRQEPCVAASAYVAGGVFLLGDVILAEKTSVWFNSVLRGDINKIVIGEGSNIQDGSILHVANSAAVEVGQQVTVGHHVNLHACRVEDAALIGIGAIVLTGAVVGEQAMVAAGAVVREGQRLEPRYLYAGVPAKQMRPLTEAELQNNLDSAVKYQKLAELYIEKFGRGHS